jgi:hypothetical protein
MTALGGCGTAIVTPFTVEGAGWRLKALGLAMLAVAIVQFTQTD